LKCFEKDNNKAFLSVITISLPLLDKFYPEYVARFSSDASMIIDSFDYETKHRSTPHLYSFSNNDNIKIINLTPSIPWTKYTYKLDYMYYYYYYYYSSNLRRITRLLIWLYIIIEVLIFYLTLPISFSIFHILNHFHIIN